MAKLKIVFEDDSILVLEKEAGVVVNQSASTRTKTLQEELSEYFGLSSGDLGIGKRAGIVHRLDRETSGLLVVAKTQKAHLFLTSQFARRLVEKCYLVLTHNQIAEDFFSVSVPIGRHPKERMKFAVRFGAKMAETKFEVQKRLKFKEKQFQEILGKLKRDRRKYYQNNAFYYTLLLAKPKTGRTHQIRVHLKAQNHPIVSDPLYSGRLYKFDQHFCPRLFLHAHKLAFIHPETGKYLQFESSLPEDLNRALAFLENC